MAQTFSKEKYTEFGEVADTTTFKDFREDITEKMDTAFPAIADDLTYVYSQLQNIGTPDVTPAEDQTVDFTEAGTKENIATTDTIKTLFSKIAKWFSSFGALAWKSKVGTDDIDDAAITNNKLTSMPNRTIKGFFSTNENTTLGTPCDLSEQNLKDMLGYLTTEDMSGYATTGHTHTAANITCTYNSQSTTLDKALTNIEGKMNNSGGGGFQIISGAPDSASNTSLLYIDSATGIMYYYNDGWHSIVGTYA